jgi:hypothetical protein
METRPGWQTTEFWLVVLVNVLPELGAIDVGSAKIKGLIHLATIVGYALARGLAKQGVPDVDPLVEEIAGKTEGAKADGFTPPAEGDPSLA